MPICSYCYPTRDEVESVKKCSRCKLATYCSVSCQTAHWSRHKPNCLPADSPVHQLFQFCAKDVFPAESNPIWWQYGFASMSEYHGDLISKEGLTSLQILLGLYQAIRIDVSFAEDGIEPPRNTIGMSKKMLQKAYNINELDHLLQRYVRNCITNHGNNIAKYCFMWLENKLIIGPTRATSSNSVEWQKEKEEMRKNIYTKYYAK